MKRLITIIILLAALLPVAAQDSLRVVSPQWISSVAGAGLLTAGGIMSRPDTQAPIMAVERGERFGAVDGAQYAPLAFPWVMKAAGSPTRSGWGRMAVSQGIGVALMAGGVYFTKHQVTEWRPDGSDSRSFPSGHAAWAFMGATMTARELAWRSPWYAVGSYALASGIGMQRVIDRRHYPADVAAGAGIGILSAQIGYLCGDLIFGGKGLDPRYFADRGELCNAPYLAVTTGLQFYVSPDVAVGPRIIHRMPGLYTSINGAYALGSHWLVGLEAGVSSTPLRYDGEESARPLTECSVLAQGGYAAVVGPLLLTGRVGAGWVGKTHLDRPDKEFSCGSGSPAGAVSVSASVPLCNGLSCAAEVGYRISRYDFSAAGANARGVNSVIYAGLSSRIDF